MLRVLHTYLLGLSAAKVFLPQSVLHTATRLVLLRHGFEAAALYCGPD